MTAALKEIIVEEHKALEALLDILDEQFKYLTKRDVFSLDKVSKKLHECSVKIAHFEMERRKLTAGKSMKNIIEDTKDKELENKYREIVKLLSEIELQKTTNDMLIKQGLGFATQMLNFLNPNKGPKTYNSYGKRK
ncbi:flagellar protein FlgN [Clostridium thailandense]|uniref:Flagellar protein FlgN n=1 Tax=Clostridium thailandense TaxID=2794346 RepID=A0A949TWJ9_9CLOT|nr:flagellar protein FlgN [Clostridium thailandense]MBV7272263.1 flagellar protein FlgN [Clostridium thailandense]MCH5137809.1 flagellar protein FlgN [Clostridiaceae bacterium UIB06]